MSTIPSLNSIYYQYHIIKCQVQLNLINFNAIIYIISKISASRKCIEEMDNENP